MLFIKVPEPDQAMLISGGKIKEKTPEGAPSPFRVIVGHGAFVPPIVRRARFLTLEMLEAEFTKECFTNQGLTFHIRAVVAFKVEPTQGAIINAGQRFLSDQDKMEELAGRIFAGHLRSIVGSVTIEEIIRDRQAIAKQVIVASETEMQKLGLLVDSFQIEDLEEPPGQGYIAALAAPHTASIQREAKIAAAQADQAAVAAEQDSARKQAEYVRETAIARATNQSRVDQETAKAEQTSRVARANADKEIQLAEAARAEAVNAKNASAEQAGPLAQAQASRDVAEAETELAAQRAELRKNQLRAEVIEPAKAAREQRIAEAEGESKAIRLAAEAAASNDRVSLDKLIIENLPETVRAAASGLSGANLTVFNGTKGLDELVTGIAGEGAAIFEAVRGIRAGIGESRENGHGNGQVSTETPTLGQGELS